MKSGLVRDISSGLFRDIGSGVNLNQGVTTWKQWPSIQQNVFGMSAITTQIISYMTVGHICFVDVELQGTSTATTLTFDLPIPVDKNLGSFMVVSGNQVLSSNASTIDNGTSQATPGHSIIIGTSHKQALLRRDSAGNDYTASGTKAWRGQFFYPIKNPYSLKYPQWKYFKTRATGFSLLTNDFGWYCKIGRIVFVMLYIIGTSNATTFTMELPIPIPSNTNLSLKGIGRMNFLPFHVADNSISFTGRIFPGDNGGVVSSKHATFSKDMAGLAFTASGTKIARGGFYYFV